MFRSKKKWLVVIGLFIAILLIGGCGPPPAPPAPPAPPVDVDVDETAPDALDEETRVDGGTLKVIIDAEPPTIDMHISTTTLVYNVGWHIFEQLYALDEQFDAIPMLASALPDICADKLVYTIPLREGVTFHNGKEMTSADVVASLTRWGEVSSNGKALFADVASLEADGPYTVKLTLNRPIGTVLVYLSIPNGGAAIFPEEIAQGAGAESVNDFIGTGPFEFVTWAPNQYIKLKKFEGYQPVDSPASGFGGMKTAYVDELYFYTIADPSVRIAGVESGEYHFADFVPVDEYERLKETAGLVAAASQPRGWFSVVFNKQQGPLSNKLVRQAFLAALNMEPIMQGGYGHPDFWRLDPSIMFKEQIWWTDAGVQNYNQNDPEKARALLAEANYDGEPIRWMTGPLEYNFSLVAKNQLEAAGFNIDLERMEWATLTDRRSNPELWDAFSTGFTFRADPTMMVLLRATYAGWWENAPVQELLAEMAVEEDFDTRYKLWKQVQEIFYDDVPSVKIGDYSNLRIMRDNVRNFANMNEIFFWNVWIE